MDITTTDGTRIALDVHGEGPLVVLLHGFPQTRRMWRRVVPRLAADHTVVALDLRGYGDSAAPPAGEETYSARRMGRDVVDVADHLGFGEFTLVGHDRGALVTFRTAMDHPDRVTGAVCLDVVPTVDTWAVLQGVSASVAWHLYLMAQPSPLPEVMISRSAPEFFGHFLEVWTKDPAALADERAHYLRASAARVDSIVADYRASAGIDLAHDRADREAGRTLAMPVGVLQQDWGAQLGADMRAIWSAWAPRLEHRLTQAGHFIAEESPQEVADLIRAVQQSAAPSSASPVRSPSAKS